jgi:hypothetical protein
MKKAMKLMKLINKYKLWILALIIITVLVYYFRKTIKKKEEFFTMQTYGKMQKAYEKPENQTKFLSISTSGSSIRDPRYHDKTYNMLYNYIILGSYNSCCDDNHKVTLANLKTIIKLGARVLDFAIYTNTKNNQPVVAESQDEKNYLPSEKPYINFDDVLKTIKNTALVNDITKCTNHEDPLFINLRIMSDKKEVLPNLAKSLKEHFQNSLLSLSDVRWRESGKHTMNEQLVQQPITNLINKVIIIVHQRNQNYKDTELGKLANFSADSYRQLKVYKNIDIVQATDINEKKNEAKQSEILVSPDYSTYNKNVNSKMCYNAGFQLVLVNLSDPTEKNARDAINYFKKYQKAIVLKPVGLRYVPECMKKTIPANPDNTFGPKKLEDINKKGTAIPPGLSKF